MGGEIRAARFQPALNILVGAEKYRTGSQNIRDEYLQD